MSTGRIEPGTWVVLRTDWYKRNASAETFLNADATGPHSPGPTAEAIEYLISKRHRRLGLGDGRHRRGLGRRHESAVPRAYADAQGQSLRSREPLHLDQLPPKGALLIAAPLKFVNGTGSPVRALALVP